MSKSKHAYFFRWKKLTIGPYEFWMIVLVVAATLLRFVLISNNWPTTNSDEATMGLMAKHIAERGELPIFFYGQAYMGPVEAYVGALLVPFLGASIFTLRLGLLGFFAFFLVCMYYLTRLLYNRLLALTTIGFLSLGSGDVLLHQLRGIGGYPEIVGLGALLFLLAGSLALTSHTSGEEISTAAKRKRWLCYGLYGFLAGFSIWTDQLILPWIATTGLLLWLFCRRELRWQGGAWILVGLLMGAAPLISYNLTAPIDNNSLTTLAGLQHAGAAQMAAQHIPGVRLLIGSLLYALPAITSIRPLCPVEVLPLFGPATTQTLACTAWQGSWTLGYLVLWGSAAWLAIRQLRLQWRQEPEQRQSPTERRYTVLQSARLLLLISAILTIISYSISPPAALVPGPTSRYLICIQIATPALLWPLWQGFSSIRQAENRRMLLAHISRIAVLLFITSILLIGTVQAFEDIPNAQQTYMQQENLVHNLSSIGATRVYSEYWTCGLLILQSNERIICSDLDASLKPALDRYPAYGAVVRATPVSTYVFLRGATQLSSIAQKLQQSGMPYQRYVFGDYIVYRTPKPLS
jgi:hypothetical protein